MNTTITGIRRWGSGWMVKLGCGCSYRATRARVMADQLYIGKAVTCAKCGEGQA